MIRVSSASTAVTCILLIVAMASSGYSQSTPALPDALLRQKQALSTRNANWQKSIDSQEANDNRLKNLFRALQTDKSKREGLIAGLKRGVDDLDGQLAKLAGREKSLRAGLETTGSELRKLVQLVNALQREKDRLPKGAAPRKKEALRRRIAEALNGAQKLASRIGDSEESLAKVERERKDLSIKRGRKQAELVREEKSWAREWERRNADHEQQRLHWKKQEIHLDVEKAGLEKMADDFNRRANAKWKSLQPAKKGSRPLPESWRFRFQQSKKR